MNDNNKLKTIPIKTKSGRIRNVRQATNEEIMARVLRKKGKLVVRMNATIYDPDAYGGKGNHMGLHGMSFSFEAKRAEDVPRLINRMMKAIED